MYKKSRILAMSKFSPLGGLIARICIAGFFCACNYDMAVLNPRSVVVMAAESPLVDLDSGKGSTAFLLPVLKFIVMSKNTNEKRERENPVLSKLPESAFETLEKWSYEDCTILKEHLGTLSQMVCYLMIYNEMPNGTIPDVVRRATRLSNLFDDLKKFQP